MGLSKEQIDSILNENSQDIGKHKATIEKLQNDIATLKADNETNLQKLKDYDPEWQAKLTKAEQDADTKIKSFKLNTMLDSKLKSAKVKDNVAVKAHLDLEKITVDGDDLKGFDEQLEKIKTDSPFLFDTSDSDPYVSYGSKTGSSNVKAPDNLAGALQGYYAKNTT